MLGQRADINAKDSNLPTSAVQACRDLVRQDRNYSTQDTKLALCPSASSKRADILKKPLQSCKTVLQVFDFTGDSRSQLKHYWEASPCFAIADTWSCPLSLPAFNASEGTLLRVASPASPAVASLAAQEVRCSKWASEFIVSAGMSC